MNKSVGVQRGIKPTEQFTKWQILEVSEDAEHLSGPRVSGPEPLLSDT